MEVVVKLEPEAVRVNAAPPATTEDGLMLFSVGTSWGATTVKVREFEVPPEEATLT
jgi:hypothetical protein